MSTSTEGLSDEAGREQQSTSHKTGHARRLSDKILIAFRHACEQGDYEVAEQLLHVLEMMLARPGPITREERRHDMEAIVAAHEWLWDLRHPESLPWPSLRVTGV